jgi:exosortase D (VPLPA-CTERM-specific)
MYQFELSLKRLWKPLLVGAALTFLYSAVLAKLGRDWWSDENYSHGLLVPFVIAYIVWLDFDDLRNLRKKPRFLFGIAVVFLSIFMLMAGTLGAELYTQRLSLVLMLIGIVIYFFGTSIFKRLIVPLALFLLAIPVPQILFNKVAFPLQLWASKAADWGIRLFNIASTRHGNVIELVPLGQTQPVGLEVVEACSGIRSLMTLVALGLILGYLTRDRRTRISESWVDEIRTWDFWRIVLLMFSAVPIALITNGARVMATGVLTYYFGIQMAEGGWHDAAGWIVFATAFLLMILLSALLNRLGPENSSSPELDRGYGTLNSFSLSVTPAWTAILFMTILIGGVFVHWTENRGELEVVRMPLSSVSDRVGQWEHKGGDLRFDPASERVLGASDYVMRYYFGPGRYVNFYAGYYASQRAGATYHSPLNCLPGSGWEMTNPGLVEITTPAGRKLVANRYLVRNGTQRQILIYWYQGRGRTTANEYLDKLYTSWDSFMKRRSDGAMIRVMTPVGDNEERALQGALDFSAQVADELPQFVPD